MKHHPSERQAQITALLENYRRSGLTRKEFSQRSGIAVSTLDYYRRREARQGKQKQALVRVNIETQLPALQARRFTIVLTNGRRIEIDEHFTEQALAKLLRVAEAEA